MWCRAAFLGRRCTRRGDRARPTLASAAVAVPRCTGVPTRGCLLPFPNDFALTKRDASTPTGRRVAFSLAEMPANSSGTHIDPTELEPQRRVQPGRADHRPRPLAQVVRLRSSARGSCRSMTWPSTGDATSRCCCLTRPPAGVRSSGASSTPTRLPAASRNLIIHPAKNLVPGRRYVVVLRNLSDRTPRGLWATTSSRLRAALRKAKVKRASVYLTWDFTVASDRSLTGRLLHIRNDAFAQLGDTQPGGWRRRGPATELHDHERPGLHDRSGRADRQTRQRHVHGAVLSEPDGLPAGRALPLRLPRARRPADPDSGQRPAGGVPVQHPSGGLHGARADRALRPRTAR